MQEHLYRIVGCHWRGGFGRWPVAAAVCVLSLVPAVSLGEVGPIVIETDRAIPVYAPGQAIRWDVRATNGALPADIALKYAIKRGGMTVTREGGLELTNGAAVIETSLAEPGTLLLEVSASGGATQKKVRALGAAVVEPARILPSAPRPDDFDEFWAAKLKELAAIPANPRLEALPANKPGVQYWHIQMDNIKGSTIQGQLARPEAGAKFPAMLILQWAGVYPLQQAWATDKAAAGWLVLNINAHDLPIDRPAAFYEGQSKGPLADYTGIGNDNRETSYFLRMYLSCYRAAEYLVGRPDWDGKVLVATGNSQGGMQTLMIAGLHPRITAAIAGVPAGCDMTGPKVGRSPGWPMWYWKTEGKEAAKVIEAGRYFDVVNFASRVRCPVLAGIGMVDETCPPAGIMAAMHEMKGAKEMVLLPHGSHQADGNAHQEFYNRSAAWLEALKQGKAPPVRELAR